jgi:hypothetical protein
MTRDDVGVIADVIAEAIKDTLESPKLQAIIDGRVKALVDDRVKALEERPMLRYLGVWNESITYEPGNVATHDGSMFHCNTRNKGVRPGDGSVWQLSVKRGRDSSR